MNCSIAEPMFGDLRKYFTLELESDTVKMINDNGEVDYTPLREKMWWNFLTAVQTISNEPSKSIA